MRLRDRIRRFLERPGTADLKRCRQWVTAAGAREEAVRALSAPEWDRAITQLRGKREFGRAELIETCALGREAARHRLGERPFDVQLLGMLGLLTGHVVEMATGEGKTLSGALAAVGFAMQGRRVHVLSVNDYLAQRDATWMGGLFEAFGVSVSWVDQHTTRAGRAAAYEADVTYVPVRELGFDVLRDRMRTDPGELVLPAPDVVLVDEADSVLVDEARVPLVLAGAAEGAEGDPLVAEVVRGLRPDEHYEVDAEGRNVHLNDAGLERVERALGEEDLYAPGRGHRLSQVHVALHAHALLRRDVDYLVRDGKVELIDDSRGRVALLQRWPDGLQAAVEAKEGVPASPTGEVLDSTVVQALIERYRTACGMSGTAVPVAEQLWEFYRLPVAAIPTNVPCIRRDHPDRLHAAVEQKETAIVEHVAEAHATGRPVLLGTLDVAESERLAARLVAAGVPGVVLNARNDAEEAALIARAGERGRVTISTQMAGRGTDIRLGSPDGAGREEVVRLGGLCLVGTGRYHTIRLDDQLRGRAGRQGDPGDSVLFTSIDDELVQRNAPDRRAPAQVDADGLVHDERAQSTVEHAQRVAAGAHLENQRTTWRYNHLINVQRTAVLAHRDEVLHADQAARQLADRCAQRYRELHDSAGQRALDAAARAIVLHHLDRHWTEHLAFLADVREGIHLRALARENPLDEFHRIAVRQFREFFPGVYADSVRTFLDASITADGVDLESMGLKRPTSTWTYLVTDNPFGTPEERFVQRIGTIVRDGAVRAGVRD